MKRTNKHTKVLEHLQEKGSITSMEAIDEYGATRLASIIFNLRKRGYDISTNMEVTKDRYGNACQYARYKLEG